MAGPEGRPPWAASGSRAIGVVRQVMATTRGRAIAAAAALVLIAGALQLGGTRALPRAVDPVASASSAAAAAEPSIRPVPGHEVYGFIPYWEIDGTIAAHVASMDVTTIGLFSVTHGSKGRLATTQSGYRRITGPIGRRIIADAHAHHRRVEIAYSSFGVDKNRTLFESDAVQGAVIQALVDLRREAHADGIAVDVEEVDNADIPAYGAFVERLRTALRDDDAAATVTATTTAGPQGAALAVAANLAGADRIFLMGYDYRTGGSEPGASAPLDRTDGDMRTLRWSLDLYAGAGIPSTRLLLGLPLYGMAWPVDSPEVGAPATGKGAVWVPRRNIATLHDRTVATTVDPVEQVGFLATGSGSSWTAVYYDTPSTLSAKLAVANDRGLAGAGLWAVGYDRGLPGYARAVAAFHAGATTSGSGSGSPSVSAPGGAP